MTWLIGAAICCISVSGGGACSSLFVFVILPAHPLCEATQKGFRRCYALTRAQVHRCIHVLSGQLDIIFVQARSSPSRGAFFPVRPHACTSAHASCGLAAQQLRSRNRVRLPRINARCVRASCPRLSRSQWEANVVARQRSSRLYERWCILQV